HVGRELRPVPGALEQVAVAEYGSVGVDAAVLVSDVFGQTLEFLTDCRSGRQPQRQPGAGERIGGEDVQIAVELPMTGCLGELVVHDALLRGFGASRDLQLRRSPGSLRGRWTARCQDNAVAPE